MMQSAKTGTSVVVGIVLGVAASTLVFFNLERGDAASGADTNATGRDKPLYWVAPMDPDYRRDKPGKSPMGMDLVPVYATGGGGVDAGPGTIEISPEVVNNLGVRTARVERRTLTTRIRTVGYVQYDEDRLIHIHPRVEGWIEKLYVKAAGDPVVQGQPLYELYSPQLVNAQEEMLLSLKRNNNRLVQAAQDRLLALQLSTSFIDELKRERQVRQTITFRAPQSGVVDNPNIREGFFVQPGTTLMSIGALDDVWVEAEVFARQAALVEVGLPVVMTLNYLPGKEWRGSVDYVYPSLDEKTRTLRIRLRFNNTAGMLKPNMFAQVFIEAGRGGDALMVPREAVIRTGSQDRVVLALGDGRFKSVAVRLGQLDEQYTQILEGLEEGDKVVVSAQFLLDSESSKSAGFMRMQLGDTEDSSMLETAADSHLQRTGADHD
ncbi:MAG: efflux RND transporter periplasmic adaptor subunit [Gammaproteobacteria bacterium]|nr:MAG: efflux RND transporter periplasmic adaptor subunit [Gammaproteobacteria bacterium]